MDQLVMAFLGRVLRTLQHFFNGSEYQREWCTEFMAYIGEETDLHQVKLMHPQGFFTLLLHLKTHTRTLHNQPAAQPQEGNGYQPIYNIGKRSSPDWRKYGYFEGHPFFIPQAIFIG